MSAVPVSSARTIYEKRSILPTTLAKLLAFHQSPAALAQLTPPPIFVQLKEDTRTSFEQGDLKFVLWLGPLPIRWWARHEPGPVPSSFADVMVEGPLAYWRHEHIFTEVPGGVELLDRVTLSHHAGLRGLFSRLMFDGVPLRILFFYRHLRTRLALRD
ncbi:MAG: hypothetical protein MUE40_05960 [Anaerolineae bacterium]|jgi:ligand-binding SRPBCC domain-containing protein|nr:hypothetical protein [Anaerolineae bacterium]